MKPFGVQSAWSYAISRLIETPGLTYQQIAEGRPDHLTPATLQVICNKLFRSGVLELERPKRTTPHGLSSPKYFIKDLDKIPASWHEHGKPMIETRGTKRQRGENKIKDNVAVGFAKVVKTVPESSGLAKAYKPVEGSVRQAEIISGKWVSIPPKTSLKVFDACEEAKKEIPPSPKIVLQFPSGPKSLSLAFAKSLYLQLKEVFE